jgi:hypothetical protein
VDLYLGERLANASLPLSKARDADATTSNPTSKIKLAPSNSRIAGLMEAIQKRASGKSRYDAIVNDRKWIRFLPFAPFTATLVPLMFTKSL